MSHLEEEILEAIWVTSEDKEPTVDAVSKRCPEPFDEKDLKRMEDAGKIIRCGEELILTVESKTTALRLVRYHRLAEVILHTVFNLPWDRREAIACEVEHTLVPELADGICTLLGHPSECPDGKAIPPGICCVSHRQHINCKVFPLTEMKPGNEARVLFVKVSQNSRLQQLTAHGLVPGIVINLVQRTPSFRIQYDGTELAIDRKVAGDIYVSPIVQKKTHPVVQVEQRSLRSLRSLQKDSDLKKFRNV